MQSNSLERNTNHGEEQAIDCVSFMLEYMNPVLIYIQINILQLVHPSRNKCNLVPDKTIIVTNEHIEVIESNSLARNTNHSEEQAVDPGFFCVGLINTAIASQVNIPQLVHPTHNKRNIVPGQTIIVTTKHIEVIESNRLERNTNHSEEQATDCVFCVPQYMNPVLILIYSRINILQLVQSILIINAKLFQDWQ